MLGNFRMKIIAQNVCINDNIFNSLINQLSFYQGTRYYKRGICKYFLCCE